MVLGTPIGPQPYVQLQMAPVLGKIARFCRALRRLGDPQISLLLLQKSVGICRVTHLLRTVDPQHICCELEALDAMYLSALQHVLDTEVSQATWAQAKLPTRLGGLGLTHCKDVAPLAIVSSALRFSSKCNGLRLPASAKRPSGACRHACELLNQSLSPIAAEIRQLGQDPLNEFAHLEPDTKLQKWYTVFHHQKSARDLLSIAAARDRVRLQCLSAPLAGVWLNTTPHLSSG